MVPLECVDAGSDLRRVGNLSETCIGTLTFGPRDQLPPGPTIAMPTDVAGYSALLYDALHRMEQSDVARISVSRIVVELPPDEPAWQAVRDRLRRASWR
jgi:L-threonylcarbamoyladenylate synthase